MADPKIAEHGLYAQSWRGKTTRIQEKMRKMGLNKVADTLKKRDDEVQAILNDWSDKYNHLLNTFNDAVPNELGKFKVGDIITRDDVSDDCEAQVYISRRTGYAVQYTAGPWKGCLWLDNEWAGRGWSFKQNGQLNAIHSYEGIGAIHAATPTGPVKL